MSNLDIEWVKVEPGYVWLGADDGRHRLNPVKWFPRHEVFVEYTFEISRKAYDTFEQQSMGSIEDWKALHESGVRAPSEAEWELAFKAGALDGSEGDREILSDKRPTSGYWGQRVDGHPRTTDHPVKVSVTRTWSSDGAVPGTTSEGRSLDKSKTRFVRAPSAPKNPPHSLPAEAPKSRHFTEAFLIFLFGVLPSFGWAYLFSSPGYIESGWFNLLFGGLVFGFSTGFLWRPKRGSYRIGRNCGQIKKVE